MLMNGSTVYNIRSLSNLFHISELQVKIFNICPLNVKPEFSHKEILNIFPVNEAVKLLGESFFHTSNFSS